LGNLEPALDILIALGLLALLGLVVALYLKLTALERAQAAQQGELFEEKHRAMLRDLHEGLAKQSDRVSSVMGDSSERLRTRVAEELTQTRESVHALQLALSRTLSENRESMLGRLAETTQSLTGKIDERLEQISGKVNERLDEGFRRTNETFVNVMARLATIDEAQKKIETLTGSVVSLQELLGDKRSRGAFGEVQLEALVRNVLPPTAFEMQYTLSNAMRVDCVLKLPDPTGLVCVDSKFPLENYHRMLAPGTNDVDRSLAQRQFRADVKKHVDDIARKYILPNETSDGAVMFVPAEAVFAEIHAYHAEVVDYANGKRVWIVSPTTLMAVLNTARAVLKDVETRKQIHVIREALARLAVEFNRFDDRLKDLARHIRQANEDVEKIQVTGGKITQQFQRIESAELDQPDTKPPSVVELREENKENVGSK
jgi:DNA recombination protein RmuC